MVQLLGAEGQFAAKAKLGAELEKFEETFPSIYGFNCDYFFSHKPSGTLWKSIGPSFGKSPPTLKESTDNSKMCTHIFEQFAFVSTWGRFFC